MPSLIGKAVNRAKYERAKITTRRSFTGSAEYWADRYAQGGNSGAGSYGELARFKADVLNALVGELGARSVIEFGCGDGAQLELSAYPSYIGLDVAPGAIDLCTQKFGSDQTKSFFLFDQDRFVDRAGLFTADVALSLDVIFHLVEDAAFERYMRLLFAAGKKSVVIYASNHGGGDPAPHVRHRKFTDWVEVEQPSWRLDRVVDNPYKGSENRAAVADFYVYLPAG